MSSNAVGWGMQQEAGGPVEKLLLILLGEYEVVIGDYKIPGLVSPESGAALRNLAKDMECPEERLRSAFRTLRDRGLFEVIDPPDDWPYPDDKQVWRLNMPRRDR